MLPFPASEQQYQCPRAWNPIAHDIHPRAKRAFPIFAWYTKLQNEFGIVISSNMKYRQIDDCQEHFLSGMRKLALSVEDLEKIVKNCSKLFDKKTGKEEDHFW